MGRPRIEWTDMQLRAIMAALAAPERDFPLDNARFLDGLVATVRGHGAGLRCEGLRAAASRCRATGRREPSAEHPDDPGGAARPRA